jgi:hypothetical protein
LNKLYTALILTALTLSIRLLTADLEYANIAYDAANHLWGAHEYSIADNQPHLPGYYLYIAAIRGLRSISGSIQSSIIFLSVLFSAFATGLFYLFLRKFWPQNISVAFALLLAVNPVVWVYGIVSDIYAFDLFISVAMVLALTSGRWIYISPILFSLGLGVRPTSPMLLIPIYIYCWFRFYNSDRFSWKHAAISHAAAIAIFVSWFIPMIDTVGGLGAYIDLYRTNNPLPRTSFGKNLIRAASHHVLFVLVLLPFLAFFFKRRRGQPPTERREKREFIRLSLLWLLPPFLFFWLFLYNKGYGLLYTAPLLTIPLWFDWRSHAKLMKVTAISIILSIALFFRPISDLTPEFFFSPTVEGVSLKDVYMDRLNLHFAMSFFSVDYFADGYREVDAEIEQRKAQGIPVVSMYVDPSSNLIARTMYFKHPEIAFSQLMVEVKLVSHIFQHWRFYESSRTDSLLANSVVISEKRFFKKYLGDLHLPHTEQDRLVFYTVDETTAPVILQRYQQYFLRP